MIIDISIQLQRNLFIFQGWGRSRYTSIIYSYLANTNHKDGHSRCRQLICCCKYKKNIRQMEISRSFKCFRSLMEQSRELFKINRNKQGWKQRISAENQEKKSFRVWLSFKDIELEASPKNVSSETELITRYLGMCNKNCRKNQ